MDIYVCTICSFIYNKDSAERSIEGEIVEFNALDPEWGCPNCSGSAQTFKPAPEGGLDIDEGTFPNGKEE